MVSIIKNIFIVLGLILIVGLGVFLFVQNSELETDSGFSVQFAAQTQDSLRKLKELERISLSQDLFSDPRFTDLIDFSSDTTPLLFGRENPFQ